MSGAADTAVDRFIADPDVEGPEALPRSNGELVFEAPWESRAFALAVGLGREGVYDWEDFRARLIAEIGAWEAEHPGAVDDAEREGWSYYDHWLTSLEGVLVEGDHISEHDHEHQHPHPHHEEVH
jgi:nitrile hydratase accessory protein